MHIGRGMDYRFLLMGAKLPPAMVQIKFGQHLCVLRVLW